MPDIIAHTADIDDQIAVARENLRAVRAGGRLLRCCRRWMIWWRNVLPIRKRGLNL
jgi:hypothetical protein